MRVRRCCVLHVAVLSGQAKMVALLLRQDLLDRGAVDGEGNTPIHLACQRGELPLLEQLLSAGRGVRAEQLTPRNNLGWAPLHTCAFQGQDQAVQARWMTGSSSDPRTCQR